MSAASYFFVFGIYFAAFVFAVGLGAAIFRYARAPNPLKIPTTPAPVTRWGVLLRISKEVFLFTSLFKANRWIWLFGWLFHVALAWVLLEHLSRALGWTGLLARWLASTAAVVAGVMLFGLLGLWGRRLAVERVRYISSPSDHLMLLLLTAIAFSGLAMPALTPRQTVAIGQFFHGLVMFEWLPFPDLPLLMIHVMLVMVLMVVFPFSKLLHAPGIFFSPTRTQVDNARERRHVAGWTADPVRGRKRR